MGVKESKLQDKIINYLIRNNIWHFRYNASATFGLPDIIIIKNGYFVGVEVKREDGKGKSTELQVKVIESIINSGGYGAVVSSMEEFLGLLNSVRT